jgi:hypothetical protein
MKIILSVFTFLALSTAMASDIRELSEKDATNAFGILTEANLVEDYAAGEYGELTDVLCNVDMLHVDEETAITCDGKYKRGQVTLNPKLSEELFSLLFDVVGVENVLVTPASQSIEVKQLACNYDRLMDAGISPLSCTVILK